MKSPFAQKQAEPRLVAKALAAFSTDNFDHTAVGLLPIPSKRYIGIVMIGLAPLFYKITITQALLDAVMAGQFPAEETIIQRFIPPVQSISSFLHAGMLTLEDRHICFQCFEALRPLL
jgi:hypothetical protein